MSRTRIVEGNYDKIIGKNYNMFTDGNTNITALGKNNFKADNKTIYDSNVKSAPEYQPENSVNVYVGMFFDGTGNNRYNSDSIYYKELAEQGGKIKAETIPDQASFTKPNTSNTNKKEEVKYSDRDSYWNPYSNIAKLFDLYKEVKEEDKTDDLGKHYILKQYVEGIGTKQDKADDVLGSGLARGSWGVISRVEEGIDKLIAEQFPAELKTKKINKIVFDVFGFSRGAAAARHFCNQVSEEAQYTSELKRDPYDQDSKGQMGTGKKIMTVQAGGRLGRELKNAGFLPVGETYKIEIRFLGLFDTVISDMIIKENLGYKIGFGGLLYSPLALAPLAQEMLPDIKTDVTKLKIDHVFHIKAQHEWRKNFAFTPTNKGYTLGMYGSHSDIGGGYAELDEYKTVLSFFDVPANDQKTYTDMQKYRTFYLNTHIATHQSIEFKNTYDHYIESTYTPVVGKGKHFGYTTKKETKNGKYHPPKEIVYNPYEPRIFKEEKIADHYILRDTRYISNKFALIPMNLMLQEAIDKKVPFFKNFDEANPKPPYKFEYDLPADEKFMEYFKFMKNFVKTKNERTDTVYNIPYDIFKHITTNYIHLSAHYGGFKNDFITVETGEHHFLESLVFINQPVAPTIVDGVVSYVREIYP